MLVLFPENDNHYGKIRNNEFLEFTKVFASWMLVLYLKQTEN